MFKSFQEREKSGNPRFAAFHFTSHDNPYLSVEALEEITGDMTNIAYRMEIMAEDVNEAPGALWHRNNVTVKGVILFGLEENRVHTFGYLDRIVVGVDPTATTAGDEAGIITCGRKGNDYYTIGDDSTHGSPTTWAGAAVAAYRKYKADLIVGEGNNGGEMIEAVIKQIDPTVNYKMVHASRGKAVRAEPIAAIAEKGHDHHVGNFPLLEDELCLWVQGDNSPNRLDAKVWAMTELLGSDQINVTMKARISNYLTDKEK
jgi:phage terminase large subunit-like protein